MKQEVEASGTLRYDPPWAWLECDLETIRYYQWWLARYGIRVHTPIWKAHITVIRDDDCPGDSLRDYEGRSFGFLYNPRNVGTNGSHWWVDVQSRDLEKLRTSVGLEPQPSYDFHLTIGKEYWRRPGCIVERRFEVWTKKQGEDCE